MDSTYVACQRYYANADGAIIIGRFGSVRYLAFALCLTEHKKWPWNTVRVDILCVCIMSVLFSCLLAQQSLHNCNVNLLPVRDLYLAFVTNFSVTSSIRLLFFSLEEESAPCSNMPRWGQTTGVYSHKLDFFRPLRLTAPQHPPYFHGPMSSIASVEYSNVKAAQSRHPCAKNVNTTKKGVLKSLTTLGFFVMLNVFNESDYLLLYWLLMLYFFYEEIM